MLGCPPKASFNIWPVSYDNTRPCRDLPLVDVADLQSPDERSRRYATTPEEHNRGIVADTGDGLSAIIYFDNGAAEDVALEKSTAVNARIRFVVTQRSDTQFLVSGRLWADNIPEKVTSKDFRRGGDLLVSVLHPSTLRFIPGSAVLCVQKEHAEWLQIETSERCGPDSVKIQASDEIFGDEGFNLGNLRALWGHTGTAHVSIRVEPIKK